MSELPGFRSSWILVPLVAWLAWIALLFFAQRRMMYPRHLLNPVTAPGGAPEGVEIVSLETPSGPGRAYYLPPGGRPDGPEGAGASAPAVLFAHGNAELAREWAGAFRGVAAEGIAVLLVEYPGYGDAPGEPTFRTITDVMVAAFDHLAERPGVDRRRIVGLGRSLGGGAVTELARHRPLAGLVLQSTFTRVRDFARRFFVPGILVRDRFDNLAVVREFDGAVLIIHGRDDEIIPWDHGRRLAEAAAEGELVTWDCGHNDCPPDWAEYVATVAAFVKKVRRPDSRRP